MDTLLSFKKFKYFPYPLNLKFTDFNFSSSIKKIGAISLIQESSKLHSRIFTLFDKIFFSTSLRSSLLQSTITFSVFEISFIIFNTSCLAVKMISPYNSLLQGHAIKQL